MRQQFEVDDWEVCPPTIFLKHGMYSRSSYTVKTKAYSYALYVYMSAQPLPIETFGMGIDVTKIILLP
jgi:hypothetical protein